MAEPRIDPCPCGCEGDVPTPSGFGTTPFVSVDGIKVYLATDACWAPYAEKLAGEKVLKFPPPPARVAIEKTR